MSREILFRGKRIKTGKWGYGDLIRAKGKTFVGEEEENIFWMEAEVYPATVGQYTGLCDKNGVKIFEGDVVEYIDCCLNYKYRGVVCFGKYEQDGSGGEYPPAMCIGFYLKRLAWIPFEWQEKDDEILRDFEKTISLLEVEDIIVIGDIHDTPALVKEKSE